ncbi:MAG: glycosyltransferase family 2 protein [Planctomycetia bacterium]|nr:glycosyltransferase family 2 protein [Planctomycetia bacterium]
MSNEPRVSVIVSNFNGAKYLPKLLETLYAQRGVRLEIIIVDRHSTDASATILANDPKLIVIAERPETGLVTGYAVGAERATSDLLFFCNEDMWFEPNCLRLLAERIDLPNRIAAADPWQWTYDAEILIHAGTRFRRRRLELNTPYPWRANAFVCPLSVGEEVPFGCAGAILIHRSAYEEVGGWDRSFFLDYEDLDLFIRTWQAGWKCITVPEAKVYHAVNVSNAKSIDGGRQLVGRRRTISGRSSLIVLGVKHFSTKHFLLPTFVWLGLLLKHAATFNGTKFWWTLLAGKETLKRLPTAWRYRRMRKSRGLPTAEEFYLAPKFQTDD